MRRCLSVLLAALVAVGATAPLLAQSKSDEKELASYALTTATLNKVAAATRNMAQEMMSDPKFQQLRKLEDQISAIEKQLEPLEAKDERTEAEDKKVESLQEQLDKAQEAKDKAEEAMSGSGPNLGNANSLDEMERDIAAFAPMARALKSAGLTPREYSKFMMAMLQAGMVYGLSKGNVDYAKLPAGINPENIKFIAAHQAELEAFQKEFAAIGRKQ